MKAITLRQGGSRGGGENSQQQLHSLLWGPGARFSTRREPAQQQSGRACTHLECGLVAKHQDLMKHG